MNVVFRLRTFLLPAIMLSNVAMANTIVPKAVQEYKDIPGVEILNYSVEEAEYVREIVTIKDTVWDGEIVIRQDDECTVIRKKIHDIKNSDNGIEHPEVTTFLRKITCPTASLDERRPDNNLAELQIKSRQLSDQLYQIERENLKRIQMKKAKSLEAESTGREMKGETLP